MSKSSIEILKRHSGSIWITCLYLDCLKVSIIFFVLMFKLKDLHLLEEHFTSLAKPSVLFFLSFFQTGHQAFAHGWPWITSLPLSPMWLGL
jgi:hypothetical protein